MSSIKHYVATCLLLFCTLSVAQETRDDVLVIVNANSLDSPQIGAYYAQQRNINPANIVHINIPDSYFISWTDFRRMRDQLIHFMQRHTLNEPTLDPAVCTDGEPPYYCNASMTQLRAHTRIRYLVTTRGVPTRMTVDGSTLRFPSAPTSVDNYLKYWLINYFSEDVQLAFSERELAFAGGRGMRTVSPATDKELIIGRIDGIDLNAAKALVDRTIAVENAGISGIWYGSTQYWRWSDENTMQMIYPPSASALQGWRYGLGMWREERVECIDYLDFSGFTVSAKAPSHCRVQFNDDRDSAIQRTQGIRYPAPGNSSSRTPLVIDALGYQGWLDGQRTIGSFDALLNWRKNNQCTVVLCDNAVDPAACRDSSSDVFGELNTACAGVAEGFMAYNHQSWPLSYFTIWPTAWFQSDSASINGWHDPGSGDVNQLAFPEVRSDDGFDDNHSLWFRNTDQVANPRCYADSDFFVAPSISCVEQRRLLLTQKIALPEQTLNTSSGQTFRVSLRYKTQGMVNDVALRLRLFIHETGAGNAQIDYGVKTLALLTAVDTDWTAAEVFFTLDPLLHNSNSFDGLKFTIDTPNVFSGDLGIDVISVKEITAGLELVKNGSFSSGHHQVATGDHAANFLNRLGGVAVWGSVGHHQSAGCAFCFNALETMVYFLRGLPLGDAVWFKESRNSGMLYGDPLYSPVAVRLLPLNNTEIQSGSVELIGSVVNGRDPLQVNTSYTIDVCMADDFYHCDRAQSWSATGIRGTGGSENTALGTLATTELAGEDFTLRLQVSSLNTLTGRSQRIADYFSISVNDPPVASDAALNVVVNTPTSGTLSASDEEDDALIYRIVSPATKGVVTVLDPATGAYRYSPGAAQTGIDQFTFKASDGQYDSNIARVTVNIASEHHAPVALDTSVNSDEDVVVMAMLSATDLNGDTLTYSLVSAAEKGRVILTDNSTGAYRYTPNANVSGSDRFSFKVNDGVLDSSAANVTINIIAVNDAPVADNANLHTSEDVAISGGLSASDVELDSLRYRIVSHAVKGHVLITDTLSGAYLYTPNTNANGADSFSFKVNDGQLDSSIAIVSIDIAAVNDAPIAVSTNLNTDENRAFSGLLLANDAEGELLSYRIVNNANNGTAIITDASTGAYRYTPDNNVSGADHFTFKVNDGLLDSTPATVSVNIAPVNVAPVAFDSRLNTLEDGVVDGELDATDDDADVLNYRIIMNGSKGTAVITDTRTGLYTYTADTGAMGADSFSYQVSDGEASSNIAIVTLQLHAVVTPEASAANSAGRLHWLIVLLLSLLFSLRSISVAWRKTGLFLSVKIN